MNLFDSLPKPFFVLAPMDDVTDTVFRQVVASTAPPDLYFTEFVNVEALQSKGREKTLPRLRFTDKERPIIAQIWGKDPENFYKAAQQIADGSLIDEINWLRAKAGNAVQGSKEERASRTNGTVNERQTPADTAMRPKRAGMSGFAGQQGSAGLSFAGVDLNFGCPEKAVVKNGLCIAMVNNRPLAGEIIQAVKEGAGLPAGQAGPLPVSVKTRLGLQQVDFTWHEFLLGQKLNMLTVHGRTAKQMSKVPANWEHIGEVRKLRDKLSPTTLIVGNGDVKDKISGLELAKKYQLDGIMIGRGIFDDPFVFAPPAGGQTSPWAGHTKDQKIALYRRHVELFAETWQNNERKVHTLNKFCKVYINGFNGAKELREKLMAARSTDELLSLLDQGQ